MIIFLTQQSNILMSSLPRVSFNKPNSNSSYQASYLQSNPALPNSQPSNLLVSSTSPAYLPPQQPMVLVQKSSFVEEIPRPQYEKTYNAIPANKRLAPESDPVARSSCCTPCWWVIATLIGLAGLTLALLYGLNVIGGTRSSQVVASPLKASSASSANAPVAATTTTSTTTTTSSTTNSTTSTPTTASTTPTATTVSPSSPASIPAVPSTNHQSSSDLVPSGITQVSSLPSNSDNSDSA